MDEFFALSRYAPETGPQLAFLLRRQTSAASTALITLENVPVFAWRFRLSCLREILNECACGSGSV